MAAAFSSSLSSAASSSAPTLFGSRTATLPRGRPSFPGTPLPSLSTGAPYPCVQLRRPPLPHRRRAAAAGPPPPPPRPPFADDDGGAADFLASFFKTQDAVRIFFAVLFWMSLFLWASAWDGRNDIRPNKRSQSRR